MNIDIFQVSRDPLKIKWEKRGYRIRKEGQASKEEQKRTDSKKVGQGDKRVFYLRGTLGKRRKIKAMKSLREQKSKNQS